MDNCRVLCNGGEILEALRPHREVIEPVLSCCLYISCSNSGRLYFDIAWIYSFLGAGGGGGMDKTFSERKGDFQCQCYPG